MALAVFFLTIKARKDYKRNVNTKKPYRPYTKKKAGKHFRNKKRPQQTVRKNIYGKEKFINSYFSFYEQYLAARRKYFEAFGRDKSTRRLEENYFKALDRLRKFEATLSSEQLEIFHKYFPNLKRETDYTNNRGIKDEGKLEVLEGEAQDPHLLPSQIESDYSTDTEESTGTIEDYKTYKGF